jgi:hypothetical protein
VKAEAQARRLGGIQKFWSGRRVADWAMEMDDDVARFGPLYPARAREEACMVEERFGFYSVVLDVNASWVGRIHFARSLYEFCTP